MPPWRQVPVAQRDAILRGLDKAAFQAESYAKQFAHRRDVAIEHHKLALAFAAAAEALRGLVGQAAPRSDTDFFERLVDKMGAAGEELIDEGLRKFRDDLKETVGSAKRAERSTQRRKPAR